ncbi:MAG TPA: thiamine phosphate synthase [Terriglobales bacterium]
MLLYYITDRTQFAGNETQRGAQILERIALAARCGVDFVQLRERDLGGRGLEDLAQKAIEAIRASGSNTRLLINSRTDVALAAGADGVHLRSADISPLDVRRIWRSAGALREPLVTVSCHNEQAVTAAKSAGADFVVFAPVFEKHNAPGRDGIGLEGLRLACRHDIPVLALGGIKLANAASCAHAGAKGVAGIRLFQQGDLEETVRQLRTLGAR